MNAGTMVMDDDCPLVSIIIPVYNRERFILRAINSVVNQNYTNWELLIVDDCSTDNSLGIVKTVVDDRIKVYSTSRNSGPAGARNVGIRAAKGNYISLLDSDDIFHPYFVSRSITELSKLQDDVGFSYTSVGNVYSTILTRIENDEMLWMLPEKFYHHKRPYLYQLQIGTAAGITFKKIVFNKVGYFDEQLLAAEDTDFFIRLCEHYKGFAIKEVLIFKDHYTADRLTGNYRKLSDAYKKIIQKNINLIETDLNLLRRWFYKSMWLDFYSGNKKGGQECYHYLKGIKGGLTPKIKFFFFAGMLLSKKSFTLLHQHLNKALK